MNKPLARYLVVAAFLLCGCGPPPSARIDTEHAPTKPARIAVNDLKVGESTGTCAVVITADRRVYLYRIGSVSAGDCIMVRRDPDGLVAIFEDKPTDWVTKSCDEILWSSMCESPVKRVEIAQKASAAPIRPVAIPPNSVRSDVEPPRF